METRRPNPDELLKQAQEEEQRLRRGKLKVFFGAAAGVGKTYAMLEAAQARKAEGVDVLVGIVETHGRRETEALLRGLDVLPPRFVEYRDTKLREFDPDAALARKPGILLVDELAHTNAPGARNAKRWQDVQALLDAGISVYTTLNVQHLESLNDVIAQITGIAVRETLPDSVLEDADEIELVDLPPDDLLRRLKEGKVYVPEQAGLAVENFFRMGNLIALRELALRAAAERVDQQARAYRRSQAITRTWRTSERILVCVSPSPLSENLVRAARRMAVGLRAEWIAVTVEQRRLSDTERKQLVENLGLAEQLGAETASLAADDTVQAIVDFARKNNVTKIIAGKPMRPRWLEWLQGSTVDQLIRSSGGVDVYVLSGEPEQVVPALARGLSPHRPFGRYLGSLVLTALATLAASAIAPSLDPISLVMLYLIAVVTAAIYLGRGPSILVSLLSILAFEFLFIVPRYGFSVRDAQYALTFSGLLLVAWVISNMAAVARDQVAASQRREADTAALSILSRSLTQALGLDEVLKVILQHVSQTFSREVVLFIPENNVLRLRASTANLQLEADELTAVHWAYNRGEDAGRGTATMPAVRLRAIPLMTSRGTVGVMGVIPPHTASYLNPDQRRLLESFASLSALALERALLARQASQTQVLQAAERLQNALLNSISHDLRTPLASITGVLSSLKEAARATGEYPGMDAATRAELIDTALDEAGRLNRLVANLLDMTRLEAGMIHLKREPCDLQDLIGSALSRQAERLAKRVLQVEVAEALPMVALDFVLMNQVLINLLDNAVKYSPPGTTIHVEARLDPEGVRISVEDDGMGIPPEDLEHVFDKFFRVQRRDGVSGTGLGLSICKGIVEAHDGRIWAENLPGGGTAVRLVLPVS